MPSSVDLDNTNLSIAGMHHMIHHSGGGRRSYVSSLLRSVSCLANRVLGEGEASPCCGILEEESGNQEVLC